MLKGDKQGFKIEGGNIPYMGNGLLIGNGPGGESVDVTFSTEDIMKNVVFVDYDEAPEAPPIQVFTF